jgi:hypothetical protein
MSVELTLPPEGSAAPPARTCWICNAAPAETGEHWAKASIARTYFGDFSQKDPIYHGRDWQPAGEVGGAKSAALKLSKSICARCNDTVTGPYDRAWDSLNVYLQAHWGWIRRAGKFYLHSVFPGREEIGARHVQLYFAKLFGCYAVEQECPISMDRLARCIFYDVACPELVLAVCHDDQSTPGRKVMHVSPIHVWGEIRTDIEGTAWMCGVSPVTIKVFYRKSGAALSPIDNTWHPLDLKKSVAVNPGL